MKWCRCKKSEQQEPEKENDSTSEASSTDFKTVQKSLRKKEEALKKKCQELESKMKKFEQRRKEKEQKDKLAKAKLKFAQEKIEQSLRKMPKSGYKKQRNSSSEEDMKSSFNSFRLPDRTKQKNKQKARKEKRKRKNIHDRLHKFLTNLYERPCLDGLGMCSCENTFMTSWRKCQPSRPSCSSPCMSMGHCTQRSMFYPNPLSCGFGSLYGGPIFMNPFMRSLIYCTQKRPFFVSAQEHFLNNWLGMCNPIPYQYNTGCCRSQVVTPCTCPREVNLGRKAKDMRSDAGDCLLNLRDTPQSSMCSSYPLFHLPSQTPNVSLRQCCILCLAALAWSPCILCLLLCQLCYCACCHTC